MSTSLNLPTHDFTVDVHGEVTEFHYTGLFKVLRHLPHRLQMERDRLMRVYLGDNAHLADPKMMEKAITFARSDVSIIEAPRWWLDKDNGKMLHDDNIAQKVDSEIAKAQKEFDEQLAKKRAEAQKDLAELAPQQG